MNNIALISDFKSGVGDNVIAYVEKGKTYVMKLRVEGDPAVRFHLQDEISGKFILLINRINTMTTGDYEYTFVAPEDALLVYTTDAQGTVFVDAVYEKEVEII